MLYVLGLGFAIIDKAQCSVFEKKLWLDKFFLVLDFGHIGQVCWDVNC